MARNGFIENVYYHYILSHLNLVTKFEPSFFTSKPLQLAFGTAKSYVIKYHEAPTADQMKQLVRADNISDQLSDDIIDVIYAQKRMLASYTDEWLYDETTNWAIIENFKQSFKDAATYLQLHENDMDNGGAQEAVEHIKAMFNRSCVLEFDDADDNGSDFWDAESHKQKKLIRSSAGYEFIDYCLNGGYFPGCLACFVGAPKSGKSLWMQNLCAESVKKGENCAYITLELPEEMVTARIGSNMFSIPSLEYEKYAKDTVLFKERIQKFRKGCLVEPGHLKIKQFPTSSLTVLELETYLLQEEERMSINGQPFKFKNIFIDYLNIMKNYRNPNSENTYMKIKQLAEDVKAMGTKNGWAIITATQTNRSQFDSNDISANQVSESSALGATVDIMFGIIADGMMKAQGKYYLKCIYDRVSPQENKKKLFDCNFNFLRLVENPDEGIIDMANLMYGNGQTNTSIPKRYNGNNSNPTAPTPQFAQGIQPKPSDEFAVNDFTNDITAPPQQPVPDNVSTAKDIASPTFNYKHYKGKDLF